MTSNASNACTKLRHHMTCSLIYLLAHNMKDLRSPQMPDHRVIRSPFSLKLRASQIIPLSRAYNMDFPFIKDITLTPGRPLHWNLGALTSKLHDYQAMVVKLKQLQCIFTYRHVSNRSIHYVGCYNTSTGYQQLNNSTGQSYTIFTNDQQLYRVAVNNTWVYNTQFFNFKPRLRGMHILMRFVGAIGTLMADTGLELIMESVLGGVTKILTGETYPQKVRALYSRWVYNYVGHNVAGLWKCS